MESVFECERWTDRERQRERQSETVRQKDIQREKQFGVLLMSTNIKHLENCELTISIILRSYGRYDNPSNVCQTNDN